MLAFATLTSLLFAATPEPPAALVFMQVESPTEKEATALLEESLRHAFSARMKVITCKEAIQDETSLKKVLEERGIKSSADAPKKVGLLTDFSRYGCEIPAEGPLWAAWLTAYADSRSKRREVSLRMRNLRDPESTPRFASLSEPEEHHLSWSELVERCVRRYFAEEWAAEVEIAPSARVRVRDPLALSARFALSRAKEAQDLKVAWSLYQCLGRSTCDQFRAAVDEYVQCRRANRSRSASDPSLTPVCVDPVASYDRVGVTLVSDRAHSWAHFDRENRSTRLTSVGAIPTGEPEHFNGESRATTLTVDIPGEYVLIAYTLSRPAAGGYVPGLPVVDVDAAHAGDDGEFDGDIAGVQRLTVEPAEHIVVAFAGTAWRPQVDAFFMVGYHQTLTESPMGFIGVGAEWGVRLGTDQSRPPPFGARGLLAASFMARQYLTAELVSEEWVVPAGLLYEFSEAGYVPYLGSMLGLAVVYHPRWLPALNVRAGVMGVSKTLEPGHSEIYGPLVGGSLEF